MNPQVTQIGEEADNNDNEVVTENKEKMDEINW